MNRKLRFTKLRFIRRQKEKRQVSSAIVSYSFSLKMESDMSNELVQRGLIINIRSMVLLNPWTSLSSLTILLQTDDTEGSYLKIGFKIMSREKGRELEKEIIDFSSKYIEN